MTERKILNQRISTILTMILEASQYVSDDEDMESLVYVFNEISNLISKCNSEYIH